LANITDALKKSIDRSLPLLIHAIDDRIATSTDHSTQGDPWTPSPPTSSSQAASLLQAATLASGIDRKPRKFAASLSPSGSPKNEKGEGFPSPQVASQ
jgi:hypothetical protein